MLQPCKSLNFKHIYFPSKCWVCWHQVYNLSSNVFRENIHIDSYLVLETFGISQQLPGVYLSEAYLCQAAGLPWNLCLWVLCGTGCLWRHRSLVARWDMQGCGHAATASFSPGKHDVWHLEAHTQVLLLSTFPTLSQHPRSVIHGQDASSPQQPGLLKKCESVKKGMLLQILQQLHTAFQSRTQSQAFWIRPMSSYAAMARTFLPRASWLLDSWVHLHFEGSSSASPRLDLTLPCHLPARIFNKSHLWSPRCDGKGKKPKDNVMECQWGGINDLKSPKKGWVPFFWAQSRELHWHLF